MGGSAGLDELLRDGVLRRAGATPVAAVARPGGAGSDDWLPAGGWPLGALIEILTARAGIGELGLLAPTLAMLGRERRPMIWIDPPYLPHAAALDEYGIDLSLQVVVRPRAAMQAWWAAEQSLRSGVCAAVMLWERHRADTRMLRRLQLAAASGGALAVLFRARRAERDASPAVLRLCVEGEGGQVMVRVIKGHGPIAARCR